MNFFLFIFALLLTTKTKTMHDLRDYHSPALQPSPNFDYHERDRVVNDLQEVTENVKQSNGIFSEAFENALCELLMTKIEKE